MHINAGQVHAVGVHLASLDDLFDLDHADLAGHGDCGVEVARGVTELQIAGLVGAVRFDQGHMRYQGTLAEKLRAGGAGIPAFFTKTGVGTLVAEGKELREFDGETYVMERSLVPDVSLVKAHRADKSGNLQFRYTSRNFNPAVAMAGKICVVEVEEIVETGEMHPDSVHLPGIYVHRIVLNAHPEKRIEKRTITEKAGV